MNERPILTAPAAARTLAIARGLAATNPAAARDYADGVLDRANAEPPPPAPPADRPLRPRGPAARLELTAKAIKLTVVVDPAALDGYVVPDERIRFRVRAEGRQLDGELKPKSMRKVLAMIAEHGAANVAVMIQGKLGDGTVEEAGIVAQVKGPQA